MMQNGNAQNVTELDFRKKILRPLELEMSRKKQFCWILSRFCHYFFWFFAHRCALALLKIAENSICLCFANPILNPVNPIWRIFYLILKAWHVYNTFMVKPKLYHIICIIYEITKCLVYHKNVYVYTLSWPQKHQFEGLEVIPLCKISCQILNFENIPAQHHWLQ